MTTWLVFQLTITVISHHLKVMVISSNLAHKYSLEQLLNFPLRDNDIRPSCLVLISKGQASDTFKSKEPGELPAFHLLGMVKNQYRTLKILPHMSLANVESRIQSGSSFVL
jgi:spore germination protein